MRSLNKVKLNKFSLNTVSLKRVRSIKFRSSGSESPCLGDRVKTSRVCDQSVDPIFESFQKPRLVLLILQPLHVQLHVRRVCYKHMLGE